MEETGQIEGLKLISEWCKWLMAVQSGAIGLIATIVKSDGRLDLSNHVVTKWLLVGSILCFIFSIVLAGAILGSIPSALMDIGGNEKVMDRPVIAFNAQFGPFWFYIPLLFISFLVGISLFAESLLGLILR